MNQEVDDVLARLVGIEVFGRAIPVWRDYFDLGTYVKAMS